MRTFILGTITFFLPIISFLVFAEIILRILPVETGLEAQTTTRESPVFHAKPNRPFTTSKDWDFKMVNKGWVNNYGFVNNQNYTPSAKRPLIAVIGDSYIEAKMVPFHETMHGRLANKIGANGSVYSFGFSGAPLSQYLVWAKYAKDEFNANALIINIVGNDFDESAVQYDAVPGFHHYVFTENKRPEFRLIEYRPSILRQVARTSALARYLILNLKVMQRISFPAQVTDSLLNNTNTENRPIEFVGNTSTNNDDMRGKTSLMVIDQFLNDIGNFSGLPPERILFTIDGLRQAIYDPSRRESHEHSYFSRMRDAFISKAKSKGFEVIDMDVEFEADYKMNAKRFEFPHDGHWSGYGHKIVYKSILKSDLFKNIFSIN